jgi:hypothetical protein
MQHPPLPRAAPVELCEGGGAIQSSIVPDDAPTRVLLGKSCDVIVVPINGDEALPSCHLICGVYAPGTATVAKCCCGITYTDCLKKSLP